MVCLGLLDLHISYASFFSQSWLLPPVMLAPLLVSSAMMRETDPLPPNDASHCMPPILVLCWIYLFLDLLLNVMYGIGHE